MPPCSVLGFLLSGISPSKVLEVVAAITTLDLLAGYFMEDLADYPRNEFITRLYCFLNSYVLKPEDATDLTVSLRILIGPTSPLLSIESQDRDEDAP